VLLAEYEDQKSTDGWVGDPNIILAQPNDDATRSRFSGFHSFNLTRKIFLANFIALAVLLVGAILVSQPQNQFAKVAKSYLHENANFQQEIIELILRDVSGDTHFTLLENMEKDLPNHDGLTIEIYTRGSELVSRKDAALAIDSPETEVSADTPQVSSIWATVSRIFGSEKPITSAQSLEAFSQKVIEDTQNGKLEPQYIVLQSGDTVYAAARALSRGNELIGYMVVQTPEHLISDISATGSKALFAFFALALGVALSFAAVLARAITNPLNDLARAAEIGGAADLGRDEAHKALIPNLSGRTDVIGRLSGAMADMTSALYERITTNESFAADVAHEIKNPLASMRSAVETLRVAKEGDGRTELLNILEMDVRRLDRLVSDISNASRLDAELVNEETERFELTKMLSNIVEFHRIEADKSGIELYWEGPSRPIFMDGLEERLAQVFVNLVTNAVSFCEDGDAVRVWCRLRGNRILAVVEDTGPGIPENSLKEIFRRFYSQRPTQEFGNHSGLGLAISKQIVEAHGGTIWAENIRKGDAEQGPVLGARFIVGFPV
jgi:two-component system sensor histidine kinase ChvG